MVKFSPGNCYMSVVVPPIKQPIGQITRGKTARNRLRRIDVFLMLYADTLLREQVTHTQKAFFIDLGYGAEPFTTLESALRFHTINPALEVLGVEIDQERVSAAVPYRNKHIDFRLGGFNIPLQKNEAARLIRAFNVLRQYDESDVQSAHTMMCNALIPGGLLMEGTSDPFGRIWTANLIRKSQKSDGAQSISYEGLIFGTNFQWGFEPDIFQPVLPKNFIHRMLPGEKIYTFMQAWKNAARQSISLKTFGLKQWFSASAHLLAEQGYRIETRKKYLRNGLLLWYF